MIDEQKPRGLAGGGLDDSSDIQLDESDFARGEPIPLDIIASELRRQSTSGGRERAPRPAPQKPSGPDGSAAGAEPEIPLISARELEELIEEDVDPEETPKENSEGQPPRKSSDVLTDRLVQVRSRAESAERQRTETMTQSREVRQQLNNLRDDMENRFENLSEKLAKTDSAEASALRRELETLRSRATTDLDSLRRKLLEVSQATDSSRNVELEAELQALRQEAAVLRHAVKEKDKVLEDLASQCRSLEDLVEDRDREMEQLYRDLEQSKDDSTGSGQEVEHSAPPRRPASNWEQDSSNLYGFRDQANTEVLDDTSLIYLPGRKRRWKTVLLASLGGLLLGVLALEAFFLGTGRGEMFSSLLQPSEPTPPPLPSMSAVVQQQKQSAQPVKRTTATTQPLPEPAAVPAPKLPANTSVVAKGPRTLRDRLRGGGEGPEMVLLPGGSFLMGDHRAVLNDEATPAHKVTVSPLAVSRTEVSFAEYDLFARATALPLPDDKGWGRGGQPVINVSWDDAVAYAKWLSRQSGQTYRLPSEAEWEYAARGGSDERHWWGFTLEQGRAVCFDCGSPWDGRRPAPVGSLGANPFGLHDTAGNVMEWVQDCFNPNYQGAPVDGSAWLRGDCEQRVVRGGAYNKPSSSLRNSARAKMPLEARLQMLGFRVVREP